MLKVFLVEDEFVVREGIKNNVDWAAHGYEFCGEASDGELAFPMIQKRKPDIVISDIKMPFMDGLELSKLIKKEMPWIEIIILTGYEEFEYAKECIKIGVAQYLTKPISGDELLKEVDALAVDIEEKRKERESREQYMHEMEENFQQERKDLFQYLVTGSKTMAELLELADKLELDISAMWYNIVLLHLSSLKHTYEEYSNSLVQIEEKLKEFEEEGHVLIFDRNMEGKAFLFKADSEEDLEKLQAEQIQKIEKILTDYEQVRYFGGIGIPVNRLRELPQSFEKASHAFAHRYLVEESLFLTSADTEQGDYLERQEFNIDNVSLKQIDRAKVREFLKFGESEEAIYFVEEFFKGLGNQAMQSKIFRQYITMDVYFSVVDFVEGLEVSRKEIEPLDVASDILQSEEHAREYIVRIIQQALELRENAASNRYGNIADKMIHYIEMHYAEEDVSLNKLAEHVNFSPNHLSMVFSQQTGQTFIKYLTDYRMNKAKELLRCTGKRSSEVSLEVGYKDPHYFSYLFKKTQGMTPTQYRGGKKAEGEE